LPKFRNIEKSPISEASCNLIKSWLSKCDATHALCSAASTSVRPKRLLYLDDATPDIVSLVSGEGENAYTALSHCWGNGKPTRTTTANLPAMNQGIKTLDISQSFQDAVHVTRSLGIKHLWVDCLCILQDDTDDWLQESSKMAEIYSSSYLVIGASRAKDCNEGFLQAHSDTSFDVGTYTIGDTDINIYARRMLNHGIRARGLAS
jgi:hypothetical protein